MLLVGFNQVHLNNSVKRGLLIWILLRIPKDFPRATTTKKIADQYPALSISNSQYEIYFVQASRKQTKQTSKTLKTSILNYFMEHCSHK